MPVLEREIAISILHRNDKDVDIQMTQERNNQFIYQSFYKKENSEVSSLVSWVIDNMPADYKEYRICLSDGGAELYSIYTQLNAIGANVTFENR